MNMPSGLSAFLHGTNDKELGSVEVSPILRLIRPATLALWIIVFAVQVQTAVATGLGSWIPLILSTFLFTGVHLQYWYEESERGQQFQRNVLRLRGKMYEDEDTGLPNSRHFVFELRRQMMRSVRSGHSFSLILVDVLPDTVTGLAGNLMPVASRTIRQAVGDGDFIARLQGAVFAAIVLDEEGCSAAQKADTLQETLASTIPMLARAPIHPVVSISGYQGELEVRDFLRRAQRDLDGVKGRDSHVVTTDAARRNLARSSSVA